MNHCYKNEITPSPNFDLAGCMSKLQRKRSSYDFKSNITFLEKIGLSFRFCSKSVAARASVVVVVLLLYLTFATQHLELPSCR